MGPAAHRRQGRRRSSAAGAAWLEPKVRAAAAKLGPCPLACRHTLAGGPAIWRQGALACAAHPGRGLACGQCHTEHVNATHSRSHELTCDRCGQVVERIHPAAVPLGLIARVRDQAGRKRTMAMPVMLAGFGCCAGCQQEARSA